MYWYSDDRSIQFNFNRQNSGQNRAFYGHWSNPVFLFYTLKYRLDRQLSYTLSGDSRSWESLEKADNAWRLFIQILLC